MKDLFMKLVEYTIPYGYEHTLEKFLPKGIQKDEFGNYFIQIGESRTMFTCHLDTIATKYVKTEAWVDEKTGFIHSGGNTTLGGDNKLGMCILLQMIERGVAGTYYFFIGEEVGAIGSQGICRVNPDFFKNFDRAIAFDRREYGDIVVQQLGAVCCSKEFSTELINRFNEAGLPSVEARGIYTDTAFFMDIIPEITNISAGGFGEHTPFEYVDLSYTQRVADLACTLDWESLPTFRKVQRNTTEIL